MSRAAAAYFEAHGDWTALSEALDVYISLSMAVARHMAMRWKPRSADSPIPDLPAAERGDAVSTVVRGYFNMGDYERCVAAAREALEQVRPDESALHLGSGRLAGGDGSMVRRALG